MTAFKHRVIFPLLAMLFGLTVAVLLVEWLLRVSEIVPTSGLQSVNASEFKTIPGVWRSNQDFVYTKIPALPHRITINSMGYRGEEIPEKKTDGELRILVTGDSFAFGDYVENTETLPSQLERQLRAKCGTKSIRVINAAIPGSTITGQAETIRRGFVLKPDLVVLVFHENDIDDLTSPLWLHMAHNRELKGRFPINILWPALHNTATWNFALHLKGWWKNRGRTNGTIAEYADEAARADLKSKLRNPKARYQNALLATYKLVRQHNTEFVFTLYPGHLTLKGKDWLNLNSWAELVGRSASIPTLNLLAGMREGLSVIDEGYLLPHDGHPSPRGHEIAARSLAQFLLSQESVRQTCR